MGIILVTVVVFALVHRRGIRDRPSLRLSLRLRDRLGVCHCVGSMSRLRLRATIACGIGLIHIEPSSEYAHSSACLVLVSSLKS